jgi:uncharacterized protein YcbK (DUF882 family)
MNITENFSLSEFECRCGCKMPDDVKTNILVLASQLQYLRDFIERPITVTNAYRCKSHNKKVGGVPNSQHILGNAADIKISGVIPQFVASMIDSEIKKCNMLQGGLGIYNTFTHYDIRGIKARWDYRLHE